MNRKTIFQALRRATSLLVFVLSPLSTACDDDSGSWSEGSAGIGEDCTFAKDCAAQDKPVACIGEIDTGASCQYVVRGKGGEGPCSLDVIPSQGMLFGSLDDRSPLTACFQEDGLACDKSTQTCETAAAVGQNCRDRACERGARCGPGLICVALPKVGEACSEDRVAPCVPDAYCDDSSTCQAQLGQGKSCTSGFQCLSRWCVSGKCD